MPRPGYRDVRRLWRRKGVTQKAERLSGGGLACQFTTIAVVWELSLEAAAEQNLGSAILMGVRCD